MCGRDEPQRGERASWAESSCDRVVFFPTTDLNLDSPSEKRSKRASKREASYDRDMGKRRKRACWLHKTGGGGHVLYPFVILFFFFPRVDQFSRPATRRRPAAAVAPCYVRPRFNPSISVMRLPCYSFPRE